MKKALKIIGKILKGVLCVALILMLLVAGFAAYVYKTYQGTVTNIIRLDDEGALYYAEYVGDYLNPIISYPLQLVQKGGCSAFAVTSEEGDYLTGRNYDLPHTNSNGEITGLNIVLRCQQEGKYASLNLCDAAWLSYLGLDYSSGALDEESTSTLPLALLPYLTMDGINEKGLTVSILALDLKVGEKAVYQEEKGKKAVTINALTRQLLDDCATVEEAVSYAENVNMRNVLGNDFHLFVTDANGKSAVFEWRNNTFIVTETNVVTNFYVSSDDTKTYWKTEDAPPAEGDSRYHYGYGHGYDRFTGMVEEMDANRTEEGNVVMTAEQVRATLEKVAQDYEAESATSFTQYSVVYNNTKKELDIWAMQNYEARYSFQVTP